MGGCFSKKKIASFTNESLESYRVESAKLSMRAYEIIDKDALHLYKISISSMPSRGSSTPSSNLTRKDPSMHRGSSYQNLRKTYFVDTQS